MLLGAGKKAHDRLANGGGGRAIFVGVDVGCHDLGEEFRREVGGRADAARRRGGELQVEDGLGVGDTRGVGTWFGGVAFGGQVLGAQGFPAWGWLGLGRRQGCGVGGQQQCQCESGSEDVLLERRTQRPNST